MLAVGFHRRPGRRPDEIRPPDARVPVVRSRVWMFRRISSRTLLSQPGRADSGRFLQTSQTEEERAEEARARVRASLSVWIGQLPSTTNPARIIAETKASHASGCLWANTTTSLPDRRASDSSSQKRDTCLLHRLLSTWKRLRRAGLNRRSVRHPASHDSTWATRARRRRHQARRVEPARTRRSHM